jgi:hypothetical protein
MIIGKVLGFLVPAWVRWAVLVAALATCYGTGRVHQARVDQVKQTARDHAQMEATVDRLVRRAAVATNASTAFEADRTVIETRTRIILREVQHVVDRPVYRDCRLDPDGVRLLNAALGGSPVAIPAREPADPVPGALPDR